MSINKLTQEQENQIISLYTVNKLTMQKISELLGYKTDRTVRRILHKNNIPINRRQTNRNLNDDYFSIIDTEEKAYFLGLLLADGCISYDTKNERQPMLRLQLIEEDKIILEQLRKALNSNNRITKDERPNRKTCCTFSIRSQKIINDLAKYSIIPNKTYLVEHFPKNISENLLKDFLRGYVDGDGSLFFSGGAFHVELTGHYSIFIKECAEQIYRLIKASERMKNRKVNIANNIAHFTFNGKEGYKVASALYEKATIYLPRKYEKYLQAKEQYAEN